MIYPILIHGPGNEILRKTAAECRIYDTYRMDHGLIVSKMILTLEKIKNGVGLAAPQVDVNQRIIVSWGTRVKNPTSLPKAMLNPVVTKTKGAIRKDTEGCLSLPDVFARVDRPQKIRVKYYNVEHELKEEWFKGFEARVILHEIDHLEGIEFFDHLSKSELKKIQPSIDRIAEGKGIDVKYEIKLPTVQ